MQISSTKEILRVLYLVSRTPQSYRLLIICSPFITIDLLKNKVAPNGLVRVPTLIITRPDTYNLLLSVCKAWKGPISIMGVQNLHAKVYIACGKDERDSIAVLGSFNFTGAAFNENIEIGICTIGSTGEFRKVINDLERKLIQIARNGRRGGRKL